MCCPAVGGRIEGLAAFTGLLIPAPFSPGGRTPFVTADNTTVHASLLTSIVYHQRTWTLPAVPADIVLVRYNRLVDEQCHRYVVLPAADAGTSL